MKVWADVCQYGYIQRAAAAPEGSRVKVVATLLVFLWEPVKNGNQSIFEVEHPCRRRCGD